MNTGLCRTEHSCPSPLALGLFCGRCRSAPTSTSKSDRQECPSYISQKSNVKHASSSSRRADRAAHRQLLAAAHYRYILPSPRLAGAIEQAPGFKILFILRLALAGVGVEVQCLPSRERLNRHDVPKIFRNDEACEKVDVFVRVALTVSACLHRVLPT